MAKLEEALKLLPHAKATEADYNRATRTLSEAYTQLADKALKANDGKNALEFAKKAIEYAPGNRAAESIIVKIKRGEVEITKRPPGPPQPPRPDTTPEFLAQREQVKKLFREGKILLNSGQYDEAERRFQQVLLVDPYNADAQELLKMVNAARQPSTYTGGEATRTRMLWQADNAWLLPTGGEVKRPEQENPSTRLQNAGSNQAIIQKLNDIIFPQIAFREASLSDVITFLSEESRKLDPKGEGVNIVLGPGIVSGAEAAPAPAAGADAAAAAPAAAAPAAAGAPGRPITLILRKIPMIDALKYITSLANLKYRVENSAVLLLPPDAATQEMIRRIYPVAPGGFTKFVTAPEAAGGGGGGGGGSVEKMGTGSKATVELVDIKALFMNAGVDFPPGSSISYNSMTSTVIIRNTPENIEAFEQVLPSFNDIQPQVEIEAKFIDISQGDLDELGFKWGVGQYNTGSFGVSAAGSSANGLNSVTDGLRDSSSLGGSAIAAALSSASSGGAVNQLFSLNGILTDPQFQVTLKALAQKQSTDVLSAPKVTVLTGQEALMEVVQEFIYPGEYSEPQVGGGGAAAATTGTGATAPQINITPSIPSSFKTKEVGVILHCTPTVGPDKNTIDLALIPEVTEFLGFIDYSPGNVVSGGASVPMKIQQPLFATRKVSTHINIWDGQTVVLGGLIKESISKIDDKVPFLGDLPILGRLFRSKVTNRSKENLLIFVTVRIIGPDGNPIHKDVARGGLR